MSNQLYSNLINHLCQELGVKDPHPYYEACNLDVNDIAFTLLHAEYLGEDCLLLYADFGELPADKKARATALQRLMHANLFNFSNHSPSFTINPENAHVINATYFALSQTSLEMVLSEMAKLATAAKLWRENFFVENGEPVITDWSKIFPFLNPNQ